MLFICCSVVEGIDAGSLHVQRVVQTVEDMKTHSRKTFGTVSCQNSGALYYQICIKQCLICRYFQNRTCSEIPLIVVC